MGLFNFLSKKNDNGDSHLYERLETIVKNRQEFDKRQTGPFFNAYPSRDKDFALHTDEIPGKQDLMYLSQYLAQCAGKKSQEASITEDVIISLFQQYNLEKAGLTDDELYTLFKTWKGSRNNGGFNYNIEKRFNLVLKRINNNGLTDTLKKTLEFFRYEPSEYFDSYRSKINETIEYVLQERGSVPVDQYDKWGMQVLHYIDALEENKRKPWQALFDHCLIAADKSTPNLKWFDKCKELVSDISEKEFANRMIEWLQLNRETLQAIHKNQETEFLRETNHNLFRVLIWCTGIINDAELQTAVDEYAAIAYKKKPGVGPLSMKTGNASMYAFSMLPFKEAVTRLMKFRNRIINNTIIKSIDKIIEKVAIENEYDRDLVEEIGVMDFGLNKNGSKTIIFEDITGTIKVDAVRGTDIIWHREDKLLKSLPAAIRSGHAIALKSLKTEIKEIDAQLNVQKSRIESYYLEDKEWEYNEWMENYILHPLVRIVAERLIWSFEKMDGTISGFILEGEFVDAHGNKIILDENAVVTLWHPINATIDETVNWRNYLQQREIIQPFKQAYREVYILTDAELNTEVYSNRFAAHILRQHQFAALCRQRGWRYNLMGNWDSHNTPTIQIPSHNITAQYLVDANWNDVNEQYIYIHIATDQVRFFEGGAQLPLAEVPALVFSEIMRDVDLFVGVTSIGNDPSWTDNGNTRQNTYWQNYSFGELSEAAKVRSEVLQTLIPRLKIKNQCSFNGKYLIVQGQLRTYKIHMGSGNILMEPNDQYLCIVPDSSSPRNNSTKIFLPFEGDGLLSIIISKAMLLAEDNKITDPTILRQIAKYT